MDKLGIARTDIKAGGVAWIDPETWEVFDSLRHTYAAPEPAPEPKATIEQDGKRYEFIMWRQDPSNREWVIGSNGMVRQLMEGELSHAYQPVYSPVSVRHRFGPPEGPWIVLEEISDSEIVMEGEWFIDIDGKPHAMNSGSMSSSGGVTILRPVSVEL